MYFFEFLKILNLALASMAQLVGASSHKPKGHEFDSHSGHIPRLQVWPLVGVCERGSPLMFLSPIDVSFPSLPLSLKSVGMSSGEDPKKKKLNLVIRAGP